MAGTGPARSFGDYDLPHDLILVHCMDEVLDYNRPVIADKLAQIEGMVEKP